MNLLIDISNFHGKIDDLLEALAKEGFTDQLSMRKFDDRNSIMIAHEILDSTGDRVFMVTDLDKCVCIDLVARALLSTEGCFIYSKESALRLEMPRYSVPLDQFARGDYRTAILEARIKRAKPNAGPGTGNFKKGRCWLMVGERPGKPKSLGERDAAFFSKEASSRWLRKQISACGWFSEEDFYWVNAFDRDGVETDWSFIKQLEPSFIVALGKVAAESLRKAGHECIEVPHPQYWKRFKSKQEYPLITEARKIINRE